MSSTAVARLDLDGNPIKPITICMIGAGGFIGSHLCEKLMSETPHTVLALDVYNDKIRHLLDEGHPWSARIRFHRLNIKHDSRLEGLIKMSDLTINLAAICTPADYNTRPLDTIYSNFIDALPVVKYCSENGKRLIHFSTCEVYGKTIGSFLPKDHPLRQIQMNHKPKGLKQVQKDDQVLSRFKNLKNSRYEDQVSEDEEARVLDADSKINLRVSESSNDLKIIFEFIIL